MAVSSQWSEWSDNIPTEPGAAAALTALSKLLDGSVLNWRPADPPPAMLIYLRADPGRGMVIVVADGWYASVSATPAGDKHAEPVAPIGRPREAAMRIARAFGIARELTPGAEHDIAVSRVLDGTTCSYDNCARAAAAAVAMAGDRIDFRCLEHWPETHAGLTRRGHKLTYYDSPGNGTGFG